MKRKRSVCKDLPIDEDFVPKQMSSLLDPSFKVSDLKDLEADGGDDNETQSVNSQNSKFEVNEEKETSLNVSLKFQTIVVQKLNQMLCKMQAFEDRLDRMENKLQSVSIGITPINEYSKLFPMATDSDVVNMEKKLKIEAIDNLVSFLRPIGGSDEQECIVRILKQMFTDELAEEYSWSGSEGKKVFKNLFLVKAIFSAVKGQQPDVTEMSAETVIANWLKSAKQRRMKQKEMEFYDELKDHIKNTLEELEPEEVDALITALQDIGVKKKLHLKCIDACDFAEVLTEIQARILIQSFQHYNESSRENTTNNLSQENSTTDENLLINSQLVNDLKNTTSNFSEKNEMNDENLLNNSLLVNNLENTRNKLLPDSRRKDEKLLNNYQRAVNSENKDQVKIHEITIPVNWHKMPAQLLRSLEANVEPFPKHYREMVRIISEDIIDSGVYPKKIVVRNVAKACVEKYSILKDKFEGVVIGCGYENLAYRLITRIGNMKRNCAKNVNCTEDINAESKSGNITNFEYKTYSYGCVEWAPNLPFNETQGTLEAKKRIIRELNIQTDYNKGSALMKVTYYLQRSDINNGASIKNLKLEWPLLFKVNCMFDHFETLTNIDVMKKLESSIDSKGKNIFAFLNSRKDNTVNTLFIEKFNSAANKLMTLLFLLTKYFGEDLSYFIKMSNEELNSQHIINKLQIPQHPCLVGKGQSALFTNEYILVIDGVIVNKELQDSTTAIAAWFCSHFIFNLFYPKYIALTMEFFQRCFLGINPSKESRVERVKGAKHYSCVHPKILSFLKKLELFEQFSGLKNTVNS